SAMSASPGKCGSSWFSGLSFGQATPSGAVRFNMAPGGGARSQSGVTIEGTSGGTGSSPTMYTHGSAAITPSLMYRMKRFLERSHAKALDRVDKKLLLVQPQLEIAVDDPLDSVRHRFIGDSRA